MESILRRMDKSSKYRVTWLFKKISQYWDQRPNKFNSTSQDMMMLKRLKEVIQLIQKIKTIKMTPMELFKPSICLTCHQIKLRLIDRRLLLADNWLHFKTMLKLSISLKIIWDLKSRLVFLPKCLILAVQPRQRLPMYITNKALLLTLEILPIQLVVWNRMTLLISQDWLVQKHF